MTNKPSKAILSRRDYIKANAVAVAAAAAGIPVPASAAKQLAKKDKSKLTWSKAPCRFCGTGCSVMVGTMQGRVVATHGDIKSEVNRGLNLVVDEARVDYAIRHLNGGDQIQ